MATVVAAALKGQLVYGAVLSDRSWSPSVPVLMGELVSLFLFKPLHHIAAKKAIERFESLQRILLILRKVNIF